MKFLLIAFALVGIAAAATFPDSATQGPNPQDIATPEPEYIDIDLPEAAPAPKPAPVFAAPIPRPVQHSVQSISFAAPIVQHLQPQLAQPQFSQPQLAQPQLAQPQLPGHFHGQAGYQYRRPVYIRRVYRRRY